MLNDFFFEIKDYGNGSASFKMKICGKTDFPLGFFLFLVLLPLRPIWLAAAEPTGGIGVILEYLPDKKIHRVRAVFQGTPAARAKIQAGEEIVSIDGNSTASMSFDDLGKKIRGNPGEAVTLVLRSPGSSTTREVRLTRVGQQTVSPLILNAPGSTTGSSFGKPSSPRLSESVEGKRRHPPVKDSRRPAAHATAFTRF